MLEQASKHLTILSLMFFGFFTVYIGNVAAQDIQLYSEQDISVEVIPEIPGPNEHVKLRLTSYSFNLNNYYIAWFKDGERQSGGYGQRDFDFTTGNSGDVNNITAVIEIGGQVFRKELRFAPSQVDLLWEVIDGYAPPFYKGKVLPIKQSDIRVTAIPETLLIEPTDAPNLVYYWDRNYNRVGSQSGFGRQYFDFTLDPLLASEKIQVTTNDRRENSFAKNTLTIAELLVEPNILFYEINDSGRLLTQQALNINKYVTGDTIRFAFQPLYMSTTKKNFNDLFVGWSINGEARPPQDFSKQNELYIGAGGQRGEVTINLQLEGIEKLLQKASGGFQLIFTEN
ncbi:hypothetical protein KC866_02025 [Patescibacteria group bacterium]|nr:hypothetical protein [Patescibacteria group bacterium]